MSVLKKALVGMGLSFVGIGIGTAADPIDARKLFADNCSGCHQAGRVGTRFAPALVKERLGALSNNAVSAMIMSGIPGTIMPPWVHKLSDAQIGALATLIRTNSADKLDWSFDDAKKSLTVLIDEKSLPAAPTYKADVMDLMGVMQRGRHAQAPESRVVFFDGKTHDIVGEVPTAHAAHILRYHPTNPRWAYVKTDTSEIYKIDLYSMKAVRSVKTGLSGPLMAVSWDGKWIAASSNVPGAFLILNADTLEPVKQVKLDGIDPSGKETSTFTGSVTAVAGGQFTVAARTLGEVWIIDPNKPDMPITKVSTKDPGETSAWLYDGYTSEDLRYLYITDRSPNDKIKIVDVIEKKYVGSLPTGCNPHVGSGAILKTADADLYFSPNGNHLCSKGPILTVWDGKTNKLVKQIKVDGGGSLSVAIHPNSPYIVVDTRQRGGGYLNLIDKKTLELVKRVDVGGATGYPEHTRDGRYLYVGAGYWGDHLRIYDSKTFELVKEYRMPAPGGTFAHARVLWGGLKGAQERPLGAFAAKN